MSLPLALADFELIRLIAEEQSLTKVAERLHKTPPAITTRLQQIEMRVGVTLCVRSPHFRLTDAGKLVLQTAIKIQKEIKDLQTDLKYLYNNATILRIMCSTSIMMEDLPLVIEMLSQQYKSVQFDIREGTLTEIQQSVSEGRCDIGLMGATPELSGLEHIPYKHERVCIIAPHDHPLAQSKNEIDFLFSMPYTFIGTDQEKRISQFIEEKAAAYNKEIQYSVIISSIDAQIELVAKTHLGIAVVLESSATRAINTGLPIKKITLSNSWAKGDFVCCVRNHRELSVVAKEFINLIRQRFKDYA